jgi:hypothetical protein
MMKKTILIASTLFTIITLQCMNLNLIESIDYESIEASLKNDYQEHIKSFLEEYKQTDCSPDNIDNILTMSSSMTGHKNLEFIHFVKDDQQNSFLKIAIQKEDLPTVRWFIEQGNTKYHTAENHYDYVNLCVNQLSPKTDNTKTNNSYNILKTIVEPYQKLSMDKAWRRYFVKEMVSLQLQHVKHRTNFVIEESLIKPFLTPSPQETQPDINLANIYQRVMDENGNTLTHIIINLPNADALCSLIQKDYVSPLKNKDNLDALALATKNFRIFSQDTSLFDLKPTESMQARCCYFLLLKYITTKLNTTPVDCFCCEEHVAIIQENNNNQIT